MSASLWCTATNGGGAVRCHRPIGHAGKHAHLSGDGSVTWWELPTCGALLRVEDVTCLRERGHRGEHVETGVHSHYWMVDDRLPLELEPEPRLERRVVVMPGRGRPEGRWYVTGPRGAVTWAHSLPATYRVGELPGDVQLEAVLAVAVRRYARTDQLTGWPVSYHRAYPPALADGDCAEEHHAECEYTHTGECWSGLLTGISDGGELLRELAESGPDAVWGRLESEYWQLDPLPRWEPTGFKRPGGLAVIAELEAHLEGGRP